MSTPHIAGLAAREWKGTAAATRAYLQTDVEDITLAKGGGAKTGYAIASGYGLGHVTPATPVLAGTIAGKVTESGDNTAISGATIVVEGTSLSATTDSNGNYSVGNVPEGDYDVTASADGHVSETMTDITVTANTTTFVDFSLATVTTASTVSVDSITYATEGGKNSDKHLLITVALVDDLGNTVGGASVSIDLYRGEPLIASGTGTTGTDGTVTFSLKNARSGCYRTDVTDVSADGLMWDSAALANEFCK
ncbi:MAG: carboxypeptidase-like regulatory domain-containing protein [Chloroflexi bacterium]|nr:carboxypeptidase-like regulatory domain-containing protein [Chloroflexota bacterium]